MKDKKKSLILRDEITLDMFMVIFNKWPVKTFSQKRNRIIMVLLFIFGLRVNEISAFSYINWTDIEEKGFTRIYQTKTKKWRELILPKKSRKLIIICNKFMPNTLKISESFLVNSKQKQLNNKYVIQMLNVKLKSFGIYFKANLKTHSFRIGLITSLFRKQIHPTVIQDIIGHSSFNTTLRYNRNITSLKAKFKALNEK